MRMSGKDCCFRRTKLDNGLRVVTETMPHVRSLAVGFWFNAGSRYEPEDFAGISHFLEHMNFKGTPRRTPAAIARQIEDRGGHLNAFTSKEFTCYHASIVDQQLSRAVDVLSDITQNSVFDPKEIDRERGVIIEELKNLEDTPDELIFEYFVGQLYSPHSMGRSVLGRRETLDRIDRAKLVEYRSRHYSGSQTVIAAAGNVDHSRLVRMVERRFQGEATPVKTHTPPLDQDIGELRLDFHTNTQQAHICWGCRAYAYNDNRKYSLLVLHTLLGAGMSSQLFQRIRERHGLAYSVFSFLETYRDTGLFGVYAGAEPKHAEKALKMIRSEVDKMVDKSISASKLQRAKDQLKGNLILGLESAANRMNRLAKMELYDTEWLSLDDIVDRIDALTVEDIRTVAQELFRERPNFTTILWPSRKGTIDLYSEGKT